MYKYLKIRITNNFIYFFILITCCLCIECVKDDSFLREKPSYITTCRRRSPTFQQCIKNLFNVFVQRAYAKDIPDLKDSGSFDPYFLPLITYNQLNSDAADFKADLINVTITGLKNFQIKDHQFSRRFAVMKSIFDLDKLRLDGKYRMVGNILGLPINGSGDFFIELGDLTLTLYSNISFYEKEDFTFMNITKFSAKLKVQKCKTFFQNPFNGKAKEVEQSTNEVINLFWRNLFEAQQPLIYQKMENLIRNIVNPALSRIPIKFIVEDVTEYYPLGKRDTKPKL